MKIFFCFFLMALFCVNISHAQTVTPEILNKINAQADAEAATFKQKFLQNNNDTLLANFKADTLRIEHFMGIYMNYDYSNNGMQQATYSAADKYDTLLNFYYQKLLAALSPEDKNVLVLAQRTWLLFRSNELKFVQMLGGEKYSGGGTMQQLIYSDYFLSLVRTRTCEIFEHYSRIAETH